MVLIDKCCGGCPIRYASLIILLLDLIASSLYVYNSNVSFLTGFIILDIPTLGLVGIIKKRPNCLLIYLIGSTIRFLAFAVIILSFAFAKDEDVPEDYQTFMVSLLIALGIYVYYTLVVFSYYQELKHESKSPIAILAATVNYVADKPQSPVSGDPGPEEV